MNDNVIYDHLSEIQKNLVVPKNRRNSFGNYNYRNCEDIVEAAKKIMPEGCTLTLSDSIQLCGDRYYVKAEAVFSFKGQSIKVDAYAREPSEKKGMDAAQLTGATSSYARKYALNGLLAIDDSKDIDEEDHGSSHNNRAANNVAKMSPKERPLSTDDVMEISKLIFETKTDTGKLMEAYSVSALSDLSRAQFEDAKKKLKSKLQPQFTQADYLRG